MSMRVLIGSLLAAMAVAGTDARAGQFVEIDSGTRRRSRSGWSATWPGRRERDRLRPSSSCMDAAASTVP